MVHGRTERPVLFSAPMVRAILAGTKTQTRRVLKEIVPPPPAMDAIRPANKAVHPTPYLDSYCGDRKTEANPRGMSNRWCWWTRDDRQGLPTFGVRWVPGDRLWVRETWGFNPDHPSVPEFACFRADRGHEHDAYKKVPAIHMPRWASRITLEVTKVRVERVQSISEEDAIAEGLIAQEGDGGRPGSGYKWTGLGYHGGTFNRHGGPTFHTPDFDSRCSCHMRGPTPAQCAYRDLWEHINGAGSWDANPFVIALTFRRVANAP